MENKKKVFIIESDARLCESLSAIMAARGLEVIAVKSESEAWSKLSALSENQRVSCVVRNVSASFYISTLFYAEFLEACEKKFGTVPSLVSFDSASKRAPTQMTVSA